MAYNKRLEVQNFFSSICPHVYFQPPENIGIQLPAIIYKLSDIDRRLADNRVYNQNRVYEVVVLDIDSESEIVDTLSNNIKCKFIRQYTANDTYHSVFEYYI